MCQHNQLKWHSYTKLLIAIGKYYGKCLAPDMQTTCRPSAFGLRPLESISSAVCKENMIAAVIWIRWFDLFPIFIRLCQIDFPIWLSLKLYSPNFHVVQAVIPNVSIHTHLHYVCLLENSSCASVARVPQFVDFSCFILLKAVYWYYFEKHLGLRKTSTLFRIIFFSITFHNEHWGWGLLLLHGIRHSELFYLWSDFRASSDSALHSSVMATTAQDLPGTGSMLISNGPTSMSLSICHIIS